MSQTEVTESSLEISGPPTLSNRDLRVIALQAAVETRGPADSMLDTAQKFYAFLKGNDDDDE